MGKRAEAETAKVSQRNSGIRVEQDQIGTKSARNGLAFITDTGGR